MEFKHTASIFTKDINRATRYTRVTDCDVNVLTAGLTRDGGDAARYFSQLQWYTAYGEGFVQLSILS